jgi:restriction endonuclease
MRLRFDPSLPHQRAPVRAVVELLAGQRFVPAAEAIELGTGVVANRIDLDPARLLGNLQAVQRRAGLEVDDHLSWIDAPGDPSMRSSVRFCNYSVEMETGTGKTYVYLRTALALAARYGLRKYVIVVPSVAIREGVLKTLEVTRAHLRALFPGIPYRYFAYDSAHLSRVRAFAESGDVDFMVVTIDAFNKASNLLRRPHDRFGGAVPLDAVRHTRPVLILDEPQNLESELSRRSLTDLRPSIALRYSATHRHRYALVHRLSPADAHAAGLVKRIDVASLAPTGDDAADARARLEVAVEVHLRRQARLRPRGIKVLTLVLVDRVDSYVGPQPWIREAFAEAWTRRRGLDAAGATRSASEVSAAYFAPRGGREGAPAVDSAGGEALADRAAYALIMRDKERLLSLEEPVAFVFSHSALREGWDNPNVSVVCSLGRARSQRRRRQEIGRGLRLCVDQSGARVADRAVNVLTVVADEAYGAYVAGLQAEERLAPHEGTPVMAADLAAATDVGGLPAAEQGALRAEVPTGPTPAQLEGLRRRVAAWPASGPDSPAEDPWPDAIDLVLASLLRSSPPRLLSRATIAWLLQADPAPARWRHHPSESARWLADAIAVALAAPTLDG